MLATNNNRGMTYQTNDKDFNNFLEYFVGALNLARSTFLRSSLLRRVE